VSRKARRDVKAAPATYEQQLGLLAEARERLVAEAALIYS
jgi:hypothetical protein